MSLDITPYDEPSIKPLMHDLSSLDIGSYLSTNEFRKFMLKKKLHKAWEKFYTEAKNRRMFFSFDMDTASMDCETALGILLNRCYAESIETFHLIASLVIEEFVTTLKQHKTDLSPLIETLEILEFPQESISAIKQYQKEDNTDVPALAVPAIISDARKLEEFLDHMDEAITDQNYNLALTYAYSCLEGVFKAYLTTNLPQISIPLELQKQAALVRDDIKQKLQSSSTKYPEPMVSLIATITSAVGNARNGYSVSHFDAKADKWLAAFARDCVNSVARMVLHFLDKKN